MEATIIFYLCLFVDGEWILDSKEYFESEYVMITDGDRLYAYEEYKLYDAVTIEVRHKSWNGKKNFCVDRDIIYPRSEYIKRLGWLGK